MLTGEIRNQVDQIWNAFWSGGVSNPLSVIEQITYLGRVRQGGVISAVAVGHRQAALAVMCRG